MVGKLFIRILSANYTSALAFEETALLFIVSMVITTVIPDTPVSVQDLPFRFVPTRLQPKRLRILRY